MTVLLLDADPLIYELGFAFQSAIYEVLFEDSEGEPHHQIWDDGREKLAFFREHKDFMVLSVQKHIKTEPESYARQGLKKTMNAIITRVKEYTKDKDLVVRVFLSGSTNFRKDIAKQKEYKVSRKKTVRPVHYMALRTYLIESWSANISDNCEADDVVSIHARDWDSYVIATIDKDLDQIPGLHYNYQKKVFYEIGEDEATIFFYQQCISGDSTDDIPGCYKVGSKGAEKAIAKTLKQSDGIVSEEALWRTVIASYEASTKKDACPYTLEECREVALETARLVRMQQYTDELWEAPAYGQ